MAVNVLLRAGWYSPVARSRMYFPFIRKALFSLFLLLAAFMAHGSAKPDIVVKGMVTGEGGIALPGVSIVLKQGGRNAITDENGRFSITIPDNGVLVFSYTGYQRKEVPVNGAVELTVNLEPAVKALETVVVTALGLERKKRTLTYSTQGVSAKELTEARELNMVNALQGKVAGLNINSGSSGVGSQARVTLRGNRSISGNSQPLYVIDGVVVRASPSDINMDNIASLNVLKGANAAALYGSAGQNGVIVIETKRGKSGVNVSVNSTYMMERAILSTPYQYEYGQGVSGNYLKTSESSWGPRMDGAMVDHWSLDPADAGTTYPFLPDRSARDNIFRTGRNWATNLSVSAGSEKARTLFTYTHTNGEGILPENELSRHNAALRITNQLTSRLTLDVKLDYMKQKISNRLDEGESSFNPLRQVATMPANIRHQDVTRFEYVDPVLGTMKQNYWNPGTVTGANPYWTLYRNLRYNKVDRLMGLASLSYQFSDNFRAMLRGSFDGEHTALEEKSYYGTYRDPSGRYAVGKGSAMLINGDFLLSYTQKLSADLTLTANAGGEIRHIKDDELGANTGTGMSIPNFFALSNIALAPAAAYTPGVATETQSLYANAQLGWKDAVFLELTGRNDWSSTLAADNRSYFYPSAGISALISELAQLPAAFTYLKLRGSWAEVGNGASPGLLQRYAASVAGGNLGYLTLNTTLPNKNLKPEMTRSLEAGIELRMFNDRIGVDVTAYRTNTDNQIFLQALPVGSGALSYYTNGGDVENTGIEVILNTTPLKTRNFTWDLNVNFARNRNTVKELSDEIPTLIVGGDTYMRNFVLEEGKPFGQIYGKGFMRDSKGRVIVGTNGLPQTTPGKTVLLGNVNPDWTGGVSSAFSWKNWSASFVISHKQGGDIASFTDAILYGEGLVEETLQGRDGGLLFGKNILQHIPAVKADGSENTVAVNAQQLWQFLGGRTAPVGEMFVRSATNTRLREFTLGYKLPETLFSKGPLASVQVSLVGRNLFFLYREAEGLDPDYTQGTGTISEGFQSFALPASRSFGANIKINFK
ncbi:SusC/RagA family TonB-linked outer membrane protein [Chitinophaga sp. 22620]|uniref:SusC/RagA family TonB-linked outer membrane protein n=1 Tax=Chitinophaga sp. 22620 TaxID=3453952 RepID=UPI003F8391EB